MSEKTIFQRIMDGELPAEKIHEDELAVVIRDINPQAPTHLLLIPRRPIPRLADAGPEDAGLLGHLLLLASEVARKEGVDDAFRLVINNGAAAGQTVFHLHLHLLGNKKYGEGSLGREFA